MRWVGCVRVFEPRAAGLCLKPRAWRPPICSSGLAGVTVAFQEVSPFVTSSPFRCPGVAVLWVSQKGKQVLWFHFPAKYPRPLPTSPSLCIFTCKWRQACQPLGLSDGWTTILVVPFSNCVTTPSLSFLISREGRRQNWMVSKVPLSLNLR